MGKYFIAVILLSCSAWGSAQEERAFQAAGEAMLKTTGIESNVNKYVEEQVNAVLPSEYKSYAGYITWLADSAAKGKVVIKWNF